MRIRSAALAAILLNPVLAQETSNVRGPIQVFHFQSVTVEQGLSNNTVTAVVQDSAGFLWIGTPDGLNRFDGYRCKVFRKNPTDSNSLCDNYVKALRIDRTGALWVGTKRGVSRMILKTERFTNFMLDSNTVTPQNGNDINVLYEDRAGTLWVGTNDGLFRLRKGLNTQTSGKRENQGGLEFIYSGAELGHARDADERRIYAILEDREGTFWFGTHAGIVRWDPTRNEKTWLLHNPKDPASLGGSIVEVIFEDQSSTIWVGTSGGGLSRLERASNRFVHFRHNPDDERTLSNNNVNCILVSNSGQFWVGTRIGLNVFDVTSGTFSRYMSVQSDVYSIANQYIRVVFQDRSGTMWFGTNEGLNRLSPRARYFRHYLREPSHPIRQTETSFLEDSHGNIWLGHQGLTRIDKNGEMTTFVHDPTKPDSLSHDNVYSIVEDHGGTVWVGTFGGGLSRFDRRNENFSRYIVRVDGREVAREVVTMLVDRNGDLWLGTWEDGALHLNVRTGKATQFTSTTSQGSEIAYFRVREIFEDSRGSVWIGTTQGLSRLSPQTNEVKNYWHDPGDSTSLSHDVINAIDEDLEGNIWIGTTAGLSKFDRHTETFRNYLQKPSIEASSIAAIEVDGRGYLWLAYFIDGLARFDPRTGTALLFDYWDGLQSNRFARGHARRANGELVFVGGKGYNIFHPDSIQVAPHVPSMVLTEFKIASQTIRLDSALSDVSQFRLSYDEQPISLEFAALDFTNPARNQYAWRLDGFFQGRWVYNGTQRAIVLTNLLPGDYILRVKGSNSDGVWNEKGVSLKITIDPLYWQSPWFALVVTVLVAAGVYGAYSYRIRKHVEMERLRLRIAHDLHDELASNLTSIAMFGKILLDERARVSQQDSQHTQLLERITQLAQVSVGAIRDIIWALDPNVETLESLFLRARDWAVGVTRAKGIELGFNLPDERRLPQHNLPAAVRQHLWLFLKEAMNNAIKHAQCTVLTVSVHYLNQFLHLRIQDNGKGIAPESMGDGKGLTTMRTRAQELGGKFELSSQPDRGTTLTLVLKSVGESKRVFTGFRWRFRYLDLISKYFGI